MVQLAQENLAHSQGEIWSPLYSPRNDLDPEMIPNPEMIPKSTPKWFQPRNDPHFSSCRPRNDPQGIREW